MIWLIMPLAILVPIGILVMLMQEEAWIQRHRPPMGWLRRLWARPQDRRHCARYRATVALTYRVMELQVPPVSAQTRDLSFGGIGIVLYEKLPVGTTLELVLRCEPPVGLLRVQGHVQWVREVAPTRGDPRRLFWVGVQIVHTGIGSAEQLRLVLRRITSDGIPPHA